MKRLANYKAKLKAAQAEETIRAREYNTAMRALKKITNEVITLQERIEHETTKLAKVASRT
jgi:predicted  nucleic acid-binding Zn-ribbon protein